MFSYRPLSVEAFEGNPTAVEVIIKSDIGNKYEDTINKFKLKEVYKEYNKVEPCPPDNTKRSLFAHLGSAGL